MDRTLKRNILKLGIFMLVAACIPLLLFSLPLDMDPIGVVSTPYVAIAYMFFCLSILIWGSIQIWRLPIKGLQRTVIFLSWAILYPSLCVWWYLQCVLLLALTIGARCK